MKGFDPKFPEAGKKQSLDFLDELIHPRYYWQDDSLTAESVELIGYDLLCEDEELNLTNKSAKKYLKAWMNEREAMLTDHSKEEVMRVGLAPNMFSNLQLDVILKPIIAPENYWQDGEFETKGEAKANHNANLVDADINGLDRVKALTLCD